MADVVIDTDILIDVLRAVQDAIDYVDRLEQHQIVGISTITHLELLVGCRNKAEQNHLEGFIQRFDIVKLNEHIAGLATTLIQTYRLSHGLLLPDALIAATALSIDTPFATKNQRDYRFINGLRLLTYP